MSQPSSHSSASELQPEPQPCGSQLHPGKALVVGFPSAYSPGGTLQLDDSKSGVAYERATSDVVLGSDEDSEEEDEERVVLLDEEDNNFIAPSVERDVLRDEEDYYFIAPSVGREVRRALSYMRDEDDKCEVDDECELTDYCEVEDDATGMDVDVEVKNEIIDEGMDEGFTWSKDYSSYHAQQETYTRTPGPTIATTDPAEIFLNIWDRDVMSMIVKETERYAWQSISAQSEMERGIPTSLEWDGTSVEEMYRFLALIILMSVSQRIGIYEYWETGPLDMPKVRKIMSQNRFFTLLRFIHFVDNESQPSDLSKYQARMYKIQPIIDHCNQKFSALFVPGQFLCFDESLLLWKGYLSFVQCVYSKAARFGVKSFELCDGTGYLLRTILYDGKRTASDEGPISGFRNATAKVVLQLMEGYLDCGHCLVMDNWYDQLSLARYLKEQKTDVIGTINRRRAYVPSAIKNLSPSSLKCGAMVAQHCGDISLIAWMDERLVTTMSTYHGNETVTRQLARKEIIKPLVVADYNKSMAGVHFKDNFLSMYSSVRRKGTKWYLKVFKRMIFTSLLNSFIIYKENVRRQGHKKVMTNSKFRDAVATGLLQRFPNNRDFSRNQSQDQAREANANAATLRHVDLHLHRTVQTAQVPGTNFHCQMRCAQCASEGRRHMVRWKCVMCNVPLQPGDCFSKYHQ